MAVPLLEHVRRRAAGRCEYCHLPQAATWLPFEIDHIIARKHGGRTIGSNLALSCWYCNSFKGSDIAGLDPQSRKLTRLFHPRRHKWAWHFRWAAAGRPHRHRPDDDPGLADQLRRGGHTSGIADRRGAVLARAVRPPPNEPMAAPRESRLPQPCRPALPRPDRRRVAEGPALLLPLAQRPRGTPRPRSGPHRRAGCVRFS